MHANEQLDALLASLNKEQRQAVEDGDGPVLVLAGAGSGKTRVLINRIAFLLSKGLATPNSFMAVTFTNKAAGEMRERLGSASSQDFRFSWIGTFHSLGARILRRDGHYLELDRSFNIYDTDDKAKCIELIFAEQKIDKKFVEPKYVSYRIGNAKNAFVFPEEFKASVQNERDDATAFIYEKYQEMLLQNNAVDFDDLLMLPVVLFKQFPEALEKYQSQLQHILVDEFQDTNRAQYMLLQLLAAKSKNLFVVGDDDQSIYRWRGADIRNILEFGKDYSEHKVFRLEQNYRSTQNILNAAHSVIVNNHGRHSKQLWTEHHSGSKVQVVKSNTDLEEAQLIAAKVQAEMLAESSRNFRDFAVLYRTNAQSRVLEEAMRRNNIAYVIVGGMKFYERKEIKDILAYLRLVANPVDTISLRRIINYPLRGVGEASLQKIQAFAVEKKLSFFDALAKVDEVSNLGARVKNSVKKFHALINKYITIREEISVTELANSLIEETGILQKFKAEATPDAQARVDNIRELMNAVHEYAQITPDASLNGFLEQISLVTDIDRWEDKQNAVTMMTLHSAKGLEFDVVFMAGLEEGLFPLSRSYDNRDDLEEERRLFYVGTTRAKQKLYITWSAARRRYRDFIRSIKSRFVEELDPDFVDFSEMSPSPSYRSSYSRSSSWSNENSFAQRTPDYENESQEPRFIQSGTRVKHKLFGVGRVISVNGHGGDAKLRVQFHTGEVKTLVVQYANLQIL